jgi:hypothetical protein
MHTRWVAEIRMDTYISRITRERQVKEYLHDQSTIQYFLDRRNLPLFCLYLHQILYRRDEAIHMGALGYSFDRLL